MQKEIHNKITRILYLLNELDRGSINLSTQADILGVSVRTLQRDINVIQEADFPLYCPKSGMYSFVDGFSLEKMKINGREASLLVFMSDVANTLGADFGKSFGELKKRFVEIPEENPYFIKIQTGAEYKTTPITKTLESAVKNKQFLKIVYKNSVYQIRPLKLAWFEGFWYLLALTAKDALFKFRLEKIEKAEIINKNFSYNENINKILKESTNIWFEEKREEKVTLSVAAEVAAYFKHKTYFPLQKIERENKDGSLLLTCHIAKYAEIMPQILHWIPWIKVISPQTLAEEVKKQVEAYLKIIK